METENAIYPVFRIFVCLRTQPFLGEIWSNGMQGLHLQLLVKPHCHVAVTWVDVHTLCSDNSVSAPHEINS